MFWSNKSTKPFKTTHKLVRINDTHQLFFDKFGKLKIMVDNSNLIAVFYIKLDVK